MALAMRTHTFLCLEPWMQCLGYMEWGACQQTPHGGLLVIMQVLYPTISTQRLPDRLTCRWPKPPVAGRGPPTPTAPVTKPCLERRKYAEGAAEALLKRFGLEAAPNAAWAKSCDIRGCKTQLPESGPQLKSSNILASLQAGRKYLPLGYRIIYSILLSNMKPRGQIKCASIITPYLKAKGALNLNNPRCA